MASAAMLLQANLTAQPRLLRGVRISARSAARVSSFFFGL